MCSSREQIYLLCPHMEVTEDVKLECKSYITIISHLDIPISVMSERPFLVLFMSLPKQFKTTGKKYFCFLTEKRSTRGSYRGSSPGLSFYLPSKVQGSWQSSPEANLAKSCLPTKPTCLPAY